MSPWSTSTRRSQLPPNWAAIRRIILTRDSHRCQARDSTGALCGEAANQVDHIIPGNDHKPTNLQSLCRWHHARKSSAEGNAARRPRPTRVGPGETHPAFR